ncbi:MAG: hypothetical protein FWD46_06220 [Cystobacterineae bacterium]|nr:hypothetical protein [Cystobacterineae bacterium]
MPPPSFHCLLWLALAQTAPVDWECEDTFSACKETCSMDYGLEGIKSPRLHNCLLKCENTVKGCRERAKRDALYAPKELTPWEKPQKPEPPPAEPIPIAPNTPPPLPPRVTPTEEQEPVRLPPPPLREDKPLPREDKPLPREDKPLPREDRPLPREDRPLPREDKPPPADDWKPWTPPPEKKTQQRPIDEWDPN